MLTGGAGADTFHFDGSVTVMDDMDTIADFDFLGEGDMVDLDALFEALSVVGAENRADDVAISVGGGDSVLTVTSHPDFSTPVKVIV